MTWFHESHFGQYAMHMNPTPSDTRCPSCLIRLLLIVLPSILNMIVCQANWSSKRQYKNHHQQTEASTQTKATINKMFVSGTLLFMSHVPDCKAIVNKIHLFFYWSTNSKLKPLSTKDALKFVPSSRYGRGSDRRWKEVLQASIVLKQTCDFI